MKVRTIASLVIVPVVLLISLVTPKLVSALCWGVLAAIGAYELLRSVKLARHPRMMCYSMVSAFLISVWSYFGASHIVALAIILIFFILLFVEMMLSQGKLPFSRVAYCFVAGIIIPYLLCSLVRILMMPMGRYYILLPFTIAFASDCCAYLVGCKFGKHKLAPVISPKKSVEGVIGGVAGAIVCMVGYGLALQFGYNFRVNYIFVVLYAVVGSACGVFGDLCFSVIKRQTGIKDYGNLIPGHGGVLDRFDSMIVVAPLVEILLTLMPLAMKG
jgi:phosphatidate cytidylyltransferase